MESELYKIRSLGGCIRAAYELFISNIGTIFRRTWMPAILFATASSVFIYILFSVGLDVLVSPTPKTHIMADATLFILGLLIFVAFIWHNGIVLNLLTGHGKRGSLLRVLRLSMFIVGIFFFISLVVYGISFLSGSQPASMPGAGSHPTAEITNPFSAGALFITATGFIFVVSSLPLIYSTAKYLVTPKQKIISILTRPYLTGWKYWGSLFMLALLSLIIMEIITIVSYMPITILSASFFMNGVGTMAGDNNGLPALFPILFIGTAMLTQFVFIYAITWVNIVFYYAYGNIEARIKSKASKQPITTNS